MNVSDPQAIQQFNVPSDINSDPPKKNPVGRKYENIDEMSGIRMVDAKHLITKILELDNHSRYCTMKDIVLKRELRDGHKSTFVFFCKMCNKNLKITSTDTSDPSTINLNTAVVSGVVQSGGG